MKLAVISTNLNHPWGGAEKPWTAAADYALDSGHSVLAIVSPDVSRHPRIQELGARGALIRQRTRLSHRSSRSVELRGLLRPAARWQSQQTALEAFRPDLVLLNQGGVFDFLLEDRLMAWARARRVPLVAYCHCNSEHWTLSAADRQRALELIPTLATLLFVSTHNRTVAERQLAHDLPQAQVVQSAIDASLQRGPVAWPANSGPLSCAVVSRLDAHHKGLDLLIPALAQAWGGESDWVVNVHGDGPDREYLTALARRSGISDRVRFHGFTADPAAIWPTNELLLLPSRHEGCSLAMLESLACGRAVLATDVGGVSDWLEDNVNSFICPAPTIAMIAETLKHARSARARWQPMGLAAAKTFATRRDPQPARTLIDLLERIAQQDRPTS